MAINKKEANKQISHWLKEIGVEETETVETPDATVRMASKFEALARKMWQMALGYTEQVEKGTGAKRKIEEVVHKPNPSMMCVLMERLEGRVPLAVPQADESKRTIADKVSEEGKKRIAHAGGLQDI
jgi:hypothetical protein